MDSIYNELFQKKLINSKQFKLLDAIQKKLTVSLYYELRLTLYLGIILLTTGLGYFAYQNIGSLGHIISMAAIFMSIIAGFYFIKKHAQPYSSLQVNVTSPYFDYLLLLVSLLVITLLTYIQVYFNLIELLLNWSSFISTILLLFMAYRYDNKALLAMGITSFAASIGLSITPIDWSKGEWLNATELYTVGILFGCLLIFLGYYLALKKTKPHFKFTYQNFGLLLFYSGCISALSSSEYSLFFTFLILIAAGLASYYTWKTKEFLFFLYSNISFYIAFTYLLFFLMDKIDGIYLFFIYYFPITCISYVILLTSKKHHFSDDQ